MLFLIRTAFWLTVVFALLPVDRPESAPPSLTAIEAFGAAQAAVHDFSGFCDRNPDACETGVAAARYVGARAEAGARSVADLIRADQPASAVPSITVTTGSEEYVGSLPEIPAEPHQTGSQDTLTAADRVPTWSGPGAS